MKNFLNRDRNKFGAGFTLVELLVVIAIISILLSIVLASISQARANARDKIRVNDVETIRTMLRLYAEDNGQYPDSDYDGEVGEGVGPLIAGYLPKVPEDPLDDEDHQYIYDSTYDCNDGEGSGSNIVIYATMETGMGENRSASNCTAGEDKYIVRIR